MIAMFSGGTGSGKSFHVVKEIIEYLRAGKNVIADFPINLKGLKKIKGEFIYQPLMEIGYLVEYATTHHNLDSNVENQTVVVIDEIYNYFDPRNFDRDDRMLWISFLKISRHYCLSFILLGQDYRSDVDKKIKSLFDYIYIHKDVRKLQWGFQLLVLFTGRWFLSTQWVCVNGRPFAKVNVDWIHLNKNFAKRYNSHHLFDNSAFMRELERYNRVHNIVVKKEKEVPIKNEQFNYDELIGDIQF